MLPLTLKRVTALANISGKEAAKVFARAGWVERGQVGSHLVMTRPGVAANLSIPQHKELSVVLLAKLIKLAGMTREEFLNLR